MRVFRLVFVFLLLTGSTLAMAEHPANPAQLIATSITTAISWPAENTLLVMAPVTSTLFYGQPASLLHAINLPNPLPQLLYDKPLSFPGCQIGTDTFLLDANDTEWPVGHAIKTDSLGIITEGYRFGYNPDGAAKAATLITHTKNLIPYPADCRTYPPAITTRLKFLQQSAPARHWTVKSTFHGNYVFHTELAVAKWSGKWPLDVIVTDSSATAILTTQISKPAWAESRGLFTCMNDCGLWPDIDYAPAAGAFLFMVSSRDYDSKPGIYLYNVATQRHEHIFNAMVVGRPVLSPSGCAIAFTTRSTSYPTPQREKPDQLFIANICSSSSR